MASHFSKESIVDEYIINIIVRDFQGFVLTAMAVFTALVVLAGTLVYVLSVGLGALSIFDRRHEREIGCVACTYDICRKGVKNQWKKLSTR